MITLRPAIMDDATRLYVWRTHKSTRAMMMATGEIRWEDHMDWLGRTLADPETRLYVVLADGQPVGTVRFDLSPGDDGLQAQVSVTVSPECRGAGYGTEILRVGTARMLDGGIKRVIAHIKAENIASQKAFAKAGYTVLSHTGSEVIMHAER